MISYPPAYGRITDADSTNWVDIVAPSLNGSIMVTACRLYYDISTVGGVEDNVMLTLGLFNGTQFLHVFNTLPLPVVGSATTKDLMGYFSNLAQYGLSHPYKLAMKVDTVLDPTDEVYTFGYGVSGQEQ